MSKLLSEQNPSNPITESNTEQKTQENYPKNNTDSKENYSFIWSEVLNYLEKKVRKIPFNTWISKLKLTDLQDDLSVISVKNEFTKNFIQQSYIKLIQQALQEVTAKSYAIRLEVDNSINEDHIELPELNPTETPNSITEHQNIEQRSLASFNTNNTQQKNKTKLNEKISLEKTYLGAFNRTCYAFAKSVLEDESNTYNSLFIHSASGLGKSHFLNLIGNETRNQNAEKKIKYVSSETFINELIMYSIYYFLIIKGSLSYKHVN